MTKEISRRDFIKIGSAAALGMTVLSGCTWNLQQATRMEMYAQAPEYTLPGEDFWFATTCRMCPAGCGAIVRVSNGRARKIEGNSDHPVSRGGLCARGQAGLQLLYHPDRLSQVLVRTGKRGQGQWGTTDWEQILARLAGIFQEVDPARVAILAGKLPHHHAELVTRFAEGLGAPAPLFYETQTSLDGRQVLQAAVQALFGEAALPVFDLGNAEVIFGFGADFLETWLSPVAYGKRYGDLRGRTLGRGVFVAFDPRLSMTAANADLWTPVPPGAEGLVALALGKILVDQGLGDPNAVADLAPFYAGVDVAAIAQQTGLEVGTLERFAHLFADAHRAVAIPGGELTGHTNGLEATQAVLALNYLMHPDGEQGGLFLSPAPPSRDLRLAPTASLADVQQLVERMAAGEVDALMVLDANPVYELPTGLGFVDALGKVANVITFATLPTETTALADIVLPTHTYLESWGYELVHPGAESLAVSAQQPVVQPLYDTRDPGDVLLALADRLGGKLARRLPWPNMVTFVQTRLTSLQLMEGNFQAEDADTFWVTWLQHGGWWSQDVAWKRPRLAEASSAALAVSPPAYAGEPETYPLHLLPVPSIPFGDGRHAGLPWLQETPDPMTTASWDTWIEVNPETARSLGIQAGDVVTVASPQGSIQAVAYEYPGIRPDVVAVPIGQGHQALGRWAKDRGANVLAILAPRVAANTGQWAWASTRVQLVKTGQRRPLPLLENNVGVDRVRESGRAPG